MSEFHFLRPYWLLALLPIALVLWRFAQQQAASRSWRAVCDARLLPHLLTDVSIKQRRWSVFLLALLLLLSVLSLAGPVWKKIPQPVFRQQSALVIALDLSRSMDASDIKPSRLARARLKIIDILRRRKEGQTALLVYAADAFTVSPLTEDSNTIVALDKTLTTDLMPEQGSRPDRALELAVRLLHQAGIPHGNVLLVTDGINPSQVDDLAKQVTSAGHRLSVLGVGTKDGAPITNSGGGFVKDQRGNIVIPKLNTAALAQLARQGGGHFHVLSADDSDIDAILAGLGNEHSQAKANATSFIADEWQEEGPWLLLLVLPLAALAFRRGYIVAVLICFLPAIPQPAHAMEWQQLWQRADQRAAKQLQRSDNNSKPPAADVFKDPEWKASAHYRAGDYANVVKDLQGIDKPDALYNKGNALAKMGRLQEAIKAYDEALKKAPQHADAKYNKEQVEKLLKQQQQNKVSSKQQQSDKNSSSQQQSKSQQQQKQGDDQAQDQKDNKDQQAQKDQQQKQQQDKASQQDKAKQDSDEDQNNKDQQNKDQQDKQQNKVNQPQQARPEEPQQDGNKAAQPMTEAEREQKERQQANEQWLRRIPDDPGGLLRRKFEYQYQRRQQSGEAGNNDSSGQQAW